ncbi:Dual specificity phosphatase, catalytic domain [Yoonia tamlensis]|uniref:Dual specificity phosphatase, catalytic domain n=1 Tax=Yoonia tamlensis TaxID=390270 RepID=A0A1I6GSE1_9RHOB|nr:protein-tyrosine phosphatase family protein [Yoonia tamlensis]SFR45122.1 Dual specificity phosphatase, catalytic domain [Yoonia tamlensis]
MSVFEIFELPIVTGRIALCPSPGSSGDYPADLRDLLHWAPALVISLTVQAELQACGAAHLGDDLVRRGIDWLHLPVPDFEVPAHMDWPRLHARMTAQFDQGHGVLIHCRGGCGRSGMLVLRAMIAAGEAPDAALARLRGVRPCAVETKAQLAWAQQG